MGTSDQASIESQASNRRRRMRTNEEKRRIVEETLVPGISLAHVAHKHGINANLLFSWRRLHRQGLLLRSREPAKLLPVTVIKPTARQAPPSDPKISAAVLPASSTQGSSIEIELPGRAVIRLHGSIEPA